MRRFFAIAAVSTLVGAALVGASCGGDGDDASDAGAPTAEGGASTEASAMPPSDAGGADREETPDASPPLVDSCGDAGVVDGGWVADPKMCLTVFADGRSLTVPRQIAFAPNGDLFVESGGILVVLFDTNHDGFIEPPESPNPEKATFAFQRMTHALTFGPDGKLYASDDVSVVRWDYQVGDHAARGPAEVVISGMPADGHSSRTLAFDPQGRLYVSVGSYDDLDFDPTLLATRSMIRRFTLPAVIPAGGLAYASGEIYASGMRNEVGLVFDSKGRFWGVENGSDGPYVSGDNADNPGEEINRIDAPGTRFFGYPKCWSEYGFDGGLGRGTQWAYTTPGNENDAWCRSKANVQPPAAVMRGHWAPLGITEYTGGSFPWKGDLVVGSHGSSFRMPGVGRLLARAHLEGDAITSVTPIVGHAVNGKLEEGTWEARPVDVKTGPDGAIYFSDDVGSRVWRLGYRP